MSKSTHLNAKGEVHMVDISAKDITRRMAHARSFVRLGTKAWAAVEEDQLHKGELWATARLAGIMAAKKTDSLIPLCHSLALSSVDIDMALVEGGIQIDARVFTAAQTGVEMEAMTAVSVSALTVYDMLKSIERGIEIGSIVLVEKRGGARGDYLRDSET